MVASSRILAVASAFAIGASAAAVPVPGPVLRRQEDGNQWLATNYTWGCSPGGCIANFFLLGQEGFPSGAPSFDVECSPVYIQQDWTACKNADGSEMAPESVVYAVWQKNDPTDPKQYINIAHVYYREEDDLYYDAQTNSTGFIPEQGGSEFFDIASVLPASESHLPPPTLTETSTDSDTPAPSGDVTVTDPVPPAGENIPSSDDGAQDDNTITPGGGPTDGPAPTETETAPPAPTETEPTETAPASDDPGSSPEVLSQPILAPGEASIGTIPPGGDGA